MVGPFKSKQKNELGNHSVTFVTHTSLKNLYKLQVLALVWKSPISVAVWASGDLNKLIELCYLITNSCAGQGLITITILIPTDQHYSVDVNQIDWKPILHPDEHTCSQRELHNRYYTLRAMDSHHNYESSDKIPYPNNKLRNVALSQVETAYALTADIDILPSMLLDDNIMRFLHRFPMKPQTALVIPVFESQHVQINQWNIERLLQEYNLGKVRPFYIETCPQCQGPTQYDNWIGRQSDSSTTLFNPSLVTYKPGWEPFVVLKTAQHPEFDERFQQFGYNRMSMICELHMSGYEFYVLDKVFLMHDGFKVEEGFHAEKDNELKHNEDLYMIFRQELGQKLGTSRTC